MSFLRQGKHICCLFDSDEEHLEVAARFIAEGLRQREHCLYSGASADTLRRFSDRLAAEGIHAQEMARKGALTLGTAAEIHLMDGTFDSESMLRLLDDKLETVLNAGYVGLRTCGDMSWLLDQPPGWEHVVTYEALCSRFFENSRAVGMCLYDRSRLPAGIINDALATHPGVFTHGRCEWNPLDRSREIAASRGTLGADYGA